ncbi:MAG: aminoacyl-tRNA hydrolase [Olsenella sp.]|jgi:PTH1 family peptidyl-tRNA hydrolase|nr:aminoacyl-tRNA hydrolase [Olsenella sp.]
MPSPAKPQDIVLVCGLGNPGAEYERTRHNIGFATVDALAQREGVGYWKTEAGCEVARLKHRCGGELREVVLAKPQSYMNTSGGPLSKLMRQLHVSPQQILVVHDEVDLPSGVVRAKFGGGLNAHNGLRSIADKLRTRDFARVRCGIGRPPGRMQVADYVLRELKGGFLEEFEATAQDAADVVETCLELGVEEAVNRTGGNR